MDKEIRLGRFDKWGYKNSFSKGELARELTYMNRDYDKLEQKVQKQKEVIDKTIELINRMDKECEEEGCSFVNLIEVIKIKDILKEV